MRSLALAVILSLSPAHAIAQLAPRSLALELGFSGDSAPALGERTPVALVATWWLVGPLDAMLRTAWRSTWRTDVRGSDAFEAGAGLRYTLAGTTVRPQVLASVSFVEVLPGPFAPDESGLRLAAGAGLEVFVARDVFAAAVGEGSVVMLPSGSGAGLAATLRLGVCF
jgi:hypothetical protein